MSAEEGAEKVVRSTPAIVADGLRSDILDGTIAPGEKINVRELGRRLEVSHIPIREAVRLLEAEGFVETKRNVGAVAAGISPVELEDVYDLRRMIEPGVARRAVERMTDSDIAWLRHTLTVLEDLERKTDGIDDDVVDAHRLFHWELLAPGASPLIERTVNSLWRISERYVRRTRGAALPVADSQHAQMVERCEHRERRWVGRAPARASLPRRQHHQDLVPRGPHHMTEHLVCTS